MSARFSSIIRKSLGKAVLMGLVCLTLGAPVRAETLNIGGTGAALGSIRLLGDAFEKANPGVTVNVPKSIGSGGGIKAAIAGAFDIGLSSRPLKPKESGAGVTATKYARTPFVLVTSRIEEETSISTAELIFIYSGEQTTWQDGHPIRLVLRPETDSDWDVLAGISPDFEKSLVAAASRRGLPVGFSDQDAMGMIEKLPGGLGTATLTAVIAEQRLLRPLIIDGIAPTLDNLANGTYPLEKSLYVVTKASPNELAQRFIAFMRSEEGVRILTETGNLVVASAESD